MSETEMRIQFWTKRLDHTLSHTAESTKQIYVVDGAVLALIYFGMQTLAVSKEGVVKYEIVHQAYIPVMLLAGLNAAHAALIINQGRWYRKIEGELLRLLRQDRVEAGPPFGRVGTHGLYAIMHTIIAISLGFVAWQLYWLH